MIRAELDLVVLLGLGVRYCHDAYVNRISLAPETECTNNHQHC